LITGTYVTPGYRQSARYKLFDFQSYFLVTRLFGTSEQEMSRDIRLIHERAVGGLDALTPDEV
jgi:hypothetical protein